MMRSRHPLAMCSLAAVAALAVPAAGASDRLGEALTPIGAERAGNADGTIPPWEGGLPQDVMERGDNPFEDDTPLYELTADNYEQYADVLTEGHKALFRTYPHSFRMKVYPTQRSASYPEWFYEETKKNADRVELSEDGHSFCCTAHGYPFPTPKTGREVMWNHLMRYNTRGWRGHVNHAAVTRGGNYQIERSYIELTFVYNNPNYRPGDLDGRHLYLMSKTTAPPSKAGDANLLHLPIDRVNRSTQVWNFSRGQRRVRRVSEVGHDNPLFDGLMTHDQVDMFNGPLDRYTVKLVGKKEMLMPYNAYKLYDPEIKYDDIIRQGHINPELKRYELRRVWVIDAELREGSSHVYKRRRFYLDEDSWLVLAQDMYDRRDEFWRTAEAHAVTFADVPVVVNGVQVHYDLQSRRYVILNMTNEERQLIEWDWEESPGYFSPSQLQRFAN